MQKWCLKSVGGGVGCCVGKNTLNSSPFWPKSSLHRVERYLFDTCLQLLRLSYLRIIPVCLVHYKLIHFPTFGWMFTNYKWHPFQSTPSEELELTANSLESHIKVTESSPGMGHSKLILRTFIYLTVNSQDELTLWACCELSVSL